MSRFLGGKCNFQNWEFVLIVKDCRQTAADSGRNGAIHGRNRLQIWKNSQKNIKNTPLKRDVENGGKWQIRHYAMPHLMSISDTFGGGKFAEFCSQEAHRVSPRGGSGFGAHRLITPYEVHP